MASHASINLLLSLSLLLLLLLLLPAALAGGRAVICEELPPEVCAFAVSSLGKRCVVESFVRRGEGTGYQCRTSQVEVERLVDWIETDDCVAACGADRRTVGISSDGLLDPRFTGSLCSPECFHNCPNIVDLYFNLAAGEGVVLSDLCEATRKNPVRAMSELQSSSSAAAPFAATITTLSASSSNAAAPSYAEAAYVDPAISGAVAAAPGYAEAAYVDPAISGALAAALSDVSELSADASFDELDADPVPVPAMPPASLLEEEGEDADFV